MNYSVEIDDCFASAKEAISTLFDVHATFIEQYAHTLGPRYGVCAEDIIQTTACDFIQRDVRFREPITVSQFKKLFLVTMKYRAIDQLRKQHRPNRNLDAARRLIPKRTDESEDCIERNESVWLKTALESLPSVVGRKMLHRRYFGSATYYEIAEEFEVTYQQARNYVLNQHDQLRYLMDVEAGIAHPLQFQDIFKWFEWLEKADERRIAFQMPFVVPMVHDWFLKLAGTCEVDEVFAGVLVGDTKNPDRLRKLSHLEERHYKALNGVSPVNVQFREYFLNKDDLIAAIDLAWKFGIAVSGDVWARDGTPYQFLCAKGQARRGLRTTPFMIRQMKEAS